MRQALMAAALLPAGLLAGLPAANHARAQSLPPVTATNLSPPVPAKAPQPGALAVQAPTVQAPATQPSTALPPLLQTMQKNGNKLSDLGNDEGVQGFLVENPAGRMQPVYISADHKWVLAGILIDADGNNITEMQLDRLRKRLDIVNHRVASATEQAHSVFDATQDIAHQPLPATDAAPPSADAAPVVAAKSGHSPASSYVSPFHWEDFQPDADATGYFDIGSPNAQTVYFVADPQCPFCHQAWATLRPLVNAGKIRLRVILVDILPGSGPKAQMLLANSDIDKAWQRGEGSTDNYPVMQTVPQGSVAWSKAGRVLAFNDNFRAKYVPGGTPFLAYKGKDGVFRSASGPNLSDFLVGVAQ